MNVDIDPPKFVGPELYVKYDPKSGRQDVFISRPVQTTGYIFRSDAPFDGSAVTSEKGTLVQPKLKRLTNDHLIPFIGTMSDEERKRHGLRKTMHPPTTATRSPTQPPQSPKKGKEIMNGQTARPGQGFE